MAREAVAASREAEDPRRLARTLVTLGNELPAEEAPAVLEEAIRLAESIDYPLVVAIGGLNLAGRRVGAHLLPDAVAAYELALQAFERTNDAVGRAICAAGMADIYAELGEDEQAVMGYEAALPALRGSAPIQMLTPALTGLAILSSRVGDNDSAMTYLAEAVLAAGPSESSSAWADIATIAAILFGRDHPIESSPRVCHGPSGGRRPCVPTRYRCRDGGSRATARPGTVRPRAPPRCGRRPGCATGRHRAGPGG